MIFKVPSNPYCMILWFCEFLRMYHQVTDRGITPLGWKNPKKDATKHKSHSEIECLNPTFSDDSPWTHQSQSCSDSTSMIAGWCSSVCLSVQFLPFTLQLYLLMFHMHIGKCLFLFVELWRRTPKTSQKRGCLFWDCFNLYWILPWNKTSDPKPHKFW